MKANTSRWLVAALLLGVLPAVVQAQFSFMIDRHATKAVVIGYSGSGGDVVIPSSYLGAPVIAIGDNVFLNKSTIITVSIPSTVTVISNNVFWGCSGLTSITVPDSVTNVGIGFCMNCGSLTNAVLGSGITSIGTGAFFGCSSLTDFTANHLTTVADQMFANCGNLVHLNIPANQPRIGDSAFFGCARLADASMVGTNTTYIGGYAFTYCAGLTNLVIPDTVTNIGGSAFSACSNLTSLVIPHAITSISDGAFDHCAGLTNLVIGTNVTRIGRWSFDWCFSLTNLVIPDSVTNIGEGAFYFCSNVVSLKLSTNVTWLTNWVFTYLSLTNAIIPAGVIALGDYALGGWYHAQHIYFLGNIPTNLGAGPLQGDPATVYYLPGTTGWGPNFVGCPAVLWNPQVQTHDGYFGVRTNRFGFNITGNDGLMVKVEACADLANPGWVSLATNTLGGGAAYFGDSTWANYRGRYYRLNIP